MGALERIAIVGTPIVTFAAVAVGLRVGARGIDHAAIVYAAPRARGASAFAWQIVTLVEDRGVRETERRRALTVTARSTHGEATWRGDTNDDGVAEVSLDLAQTARGEPIELEVRSDGEPEPLAKGRVAWDDAAWMNGAPGPFARPSRREGRISLDVAVLGGKLAPRVPTSLLVRATSSGDGHVIAGATVSVEPEPGLEVTPPSQSTCSGGWARFIAEPLMFVAALTVRARTPDGRTGEWFGGAPVAPGAMAVTMDETVDARAAPRVTLAGSTERPVYVEIDDEVGRAAAVTSALTPDGEVARATVTFSPLQPGLKWLVASSEPRGAETLEGVTRAIPFLVLGSSMPIGAPTTPDPCAALGYLALHPAGSFRRWVALDGFVGRAGANAAKRRRGLLIGLAALLSGSLLELLLLLRAARRGKRFADVEGVAAMTHRTGAWNVAVGILVALLGFALVAALLLVRA